MSAVLVVSDSVADADVVRSVLRQEGFDAARSVDPRRLVADFEHGRPRVLVLAYKALEAAERHYLSLYRRSHAINGLPHRTLVLCQMDSTREAWERCRAGVFDDYVQFWPLNHDALSLPKAVHLALRAVDGQQQAASMAQLSAQARRIAELETLLDAQLAAGRVHAGALAQAGAAAQASIGAALKGLERSIVDDGLDNALVVRDAAQVHRSLDRVDQQVVQPALGRVQQALAPVQHWMGGLKDELAAPVAAARALARRAGTLRPQVLVVDDDSFVVRALKQVLDAAYCDMHSAADAAAAMQALRRCTPDLILMDVGLPDISGIEIVKQLKANAMLSGVPVLMLTGHSEKETIVESMAAGASDFVVKPFDRDLLLKKVNRLLGGRSAGEA
ncbi:MAG: response regulator [Rubrivivax sp.]|nr:response regulator [Rubrivivax sp.]